MLPVGMAKSPLAPPIGKDLVLPPKLISLTFTNLWRVHQWFHAQIPSAHGLVWTARRDDDAKAVVLFGDRINVKKLQVKVDREPLLNFRDELLALAEHIGITKLVKTSF